MFQVSKAIPFCYGHRLVGHKGKCCHLHGHNATAVVKLVTDQLDDQGMVWDFIDIKELVKSWIDEHIDHTLLLYAEDPILPALHAAGERVQVVPFNPTAENIARMIYEYVAGLKLPVHSVTVWETESSSATYQPGASSDAS